MLRPKGHWGGLEPRGKPGVIESLIVLSALFVLVVLTLPTIGYVRSTLQNRETARDLRSFAEAFRDYGSETGAYPHKEQPGIIPESMASRLPRERWEKTTPLGGHYVWENGCGLEDAEQFVGVSAPRVSVEQLADLDRRIDDGDLTSGRVRLSGDTLCLMIDK